MEKTFTAPLAVIKHKGISIGKMKGITLTETWRRGKVSGIGEITPSEVPVLDWDGKLTTEFYEVSFKKSGIPDAIKRVAGSLQAFIDNILLQDESLDIVIYKKVGDFIDENGLKRAKLEEHLTVTGCFIDREGMTLQENQISGHNQDFTYINPVLYTPGS